MSYTVIAKILLSGYIIYPLLKKIYTETQVHVLHIISLWSDRF